MVMAVRRLRQSLRSSRHRWRRGWRGGAGLLDARIESILRPAQSGNNESLLFPLLFSGTCIVTSRRFVGRVRFVQILHVEPASRLVLCFKLTLPVLLDSDEICGAHRKGVEETNSESTSRYRAPIRTSEPRRERLLPGRGTLVQAEESMVRRGRERGRATLSERESVGVYLCMGGSLPLCVSAGRGEYI